jgi:hypothetical protein
MHEDTCILPLTKSVVYDIGISYAENAVTSLQHTICEVIVFGKK